MLATQEPLLPTRRARHSIGPTAISRPHLSRKKLSAVLHASSADRVCGATCVFLPLCAHVVRPAAAAAAAATSASLSVRVVSTMSVVKTSLKLFVFAAVTVLALLLLRNWMATKQYVFSKEDVAKLAKQYAGEFGTEEFCV